MKVVFDRIIAKLENVSEKDDYGDIVDLAEAIDIVFEIKHDYEDRFINIDTYKQVRWERDVAIKQLSELGISLGEKINGKYLREEKYKELLEYKYMYEDLCR